MQQPPQPGFTTSVTCAAMSVVASNVPADQFAERQHGPVWWIITCLLHVWLCAASLRHGHCMEQEAGQDRWVLFVHKVCTTLFSVSIRTYIHTYICKVSIVCMYVPTYIQLVDCLR